MTEQELELALDKAHDEATIQAAELVGPNAVEYDDLVELIYEKLSDTIYAKADASRPVEEEHRLTEKMRQQRDKLLWKVERLEHELGRLMARHGPQ